MLTSIGEKIYTAKLLYELTNYLQLYMMYSSQYHNRRRPINKTVSMIKILTLFVMCSLTSSQFFMVAMQKKPKKQTKTQREQMFAFSGDIHRVATFTHVSSLTVVVGIFSCPLHGSQRFLCLLSITFKVATNLGTNMYAHIVYSYSHLTF